MSHYETNRFLKNISLNVLAIISMILIAAATPAIDSEDTVNTVCAVEDAEEEKFQEENVDEMNLNYDPPCKEEAKEGEAEVVADEGFKIILFFIIFVTAPGLIFMVYLLLDNSDFFQHFLQNLVTQILF